MDRPRLLVCLYCSAIIWSSTQYCSACWSALEYLMRQSPGFASRKGLQIHYLWEWRREYILNHGSYALKKLCCEPTWIRLAELLTHRSGLSEWTDGILIPAPPRKVGEEDHAFRLARGLSQVTGFPLHTLLRRNEFGPAQKSKTARQRHEIELQMDGKLGDFKGLRPIFVDDIVTTGATAQAAKVALRWQTPFTVLALYCRPFHALV